MTISGGIWSSFNPRVLAGGRDRRQKPIRLGAAVSIHASSREDATRRNRRPRAAGAGFNPRVLAGGRDRRLRSQWRSAAFQSTRPRGRTRLAASSDSSRACGFNPRVLAGGRDTLPFSGDNYDSVSIHASSREDATGKTSPPICPISFNPRVLAGGRDVLSDQRRTWEGFQSTRPRGRTRPHALTCRM